MAQICYPDRDGNIVVIKNPTDEQFHEACLIVAENIFRLACKEMPLDTPSEITPNQATS